MPMPSALLVKNGSKTFFSLSWGMPGPGQTRITGKVLDAGSPNADGAVFGWRILHRVDPVDGQVNNDLLELDVITVIDSAIGARELFNSTFRPMATAERN